MVGLFRAQANHAAWNCRQVVRKIFRPQAGRFVAQNVFLSHNPPGSLRGESCDLGIVDQPR